MSKPTVFIKIASLDDSELSHTIENAVESAKYPERLRFGIYLHYSTDVAKQELLDYADRLSLRSSFQLELETFNKAHLGVGRARYKAESMYDGEDYVLQIDSHSWFCQDWDELLIGLFINQTPKTILTGYAPAYISQNGKREPKGKGFLLPVYNHKREPVDWILNWHTISPPSTLSFINTKFCANFAFGTSEWGKYSGLNKDSIFWSEEPLQTRNLLRNGFQMRLPNIDYPLICHLYERDIVGEGGKRSDIGAYISAEEKEYLINVVDKEVYMSSFTHPQSQSSLPYK
ncbi:MAG: GlcNAc-transferase family protein [Rhodospirillaceae bacterium]|jgi:hypothetical protein